MALLFLILRALLMRIYRGEIGVILINHGKEAFTIERGMRIAQMVVERHSTVTWEVVESLDDTERGAGGFGLDRYKRLNSLQTLGKLPKTP